MANPVIYTGHATGDTLPAADWQNNWGLVESGALDLGAWVISGLVPTIGTGLSVNVSAGVALIGAHLAVASFSIVGLTDATTNHLYLLQSGAGASNTTGTAPAASTKLGTCITAGGAVTSVSILRSSGRQQWVQPVNLVPGGSAAGNPGSINLAGWAAAAADAVPVYGVLPAGAVLAASLPADVAYIDVAQTWTQPPIFPGLTSSGHLLSTGTIPSVAAQPGAGTTPPAPVIVAGSTDVRGQITFGTGTAPTAGAQVRLTFAAAFGTTPQIFLQATDDTLTGIVFTVANRTPAHWDFYAHTALAASQPNTTYSFSYFCVG